MLLKLLGTSHPEDASDDAQVSSPPAKKPKTSHPDTSQCVCVYMHVVSLVYELI